MENASLSVMLDEDSGHDRSNDGNACPVYDLR